MPRNSTLISDALDELAKVDPELAQVGGFEIFLRIFVCGNRRHAADSRNERYRENGRRPEFISTAAFARIYPTEESMPRTELLNSGGP